jgi:hypothetical protein
MAVYRKTRKVVLKRGERSADLMHETRDNTVDVLQTESEIEQLMLKLNEAVELILELRAGNEVQSNETQLREISRTVANLEQMKIPVPDELRKLKATLVVKVNETEEAEKLLKLTDATLSKLQAKVRSGLSIDLQPPGARRRRRRSGREGVSTGEDQSERSRLLQKFWQGLLAQAEGKSKLHAGKSAPERHWLSAGSGLGGLSYGYITRQHETAVELYIDRGEFDLNKRTFDRLHSQQEVVEQAFGNSFSWERLDAKRGCRIAYKMTLGGYLSEESKWPAIQEAMVSAMVQLERTIEPLLLDIRRSILR